MNRSHLILLLAFLLQFHHCAAGEERVFFAFDDQSIPWRNNLKLTMVQADKHPANPVLKCGPEGAPDHGHALIYGSVLQIAGKFRMWYLGNPGGRSEKAQPPTYWRPMCYAESDDGVHWVKPDLGLVELNGSKKNNICLIESEIFSLTRVNDFLSVMYDPDEPDAAKRYKCAYIAHVPFAEVRGGRSKIGPDEKRWCSLVCAASGDGLRWKVVGEQPANAGGERFEVSGLYRFGQFYYASGQLLGPWLLRPDGEKIGRAMRIYRSPDFVRWDQTTALGFARPGQLMPQPAPGQQTHMGAGIWNRGNVLVGVYGQWQDAPQKPPKGTKNHLLGTRIDLGLIISNDGVHWREPAPDFKIIPRGADGQWDDLALLQGHAFANVGQQTYLWYSHWDIDGGSRNQDIGLAMLRRDGFGYLSAHEPGAAASLETAFFDVPQGARLRLNVDGVAAERPLRVEVLNSMLEVVGAATATTPGTGVEALSLPKGRLAVRLSWGEGCAGKLYALYVDD